MSQNLSLSLEYGSIEKFNVQVPWLQLHTGQINVFVDTVVLIFRINVLDHDKDGAKSNESFTQELKMVRVRTTSLVHFATCTNVTAPCVCNLGIAE